MPDSFTPKHYPRTRLPSGRVLSDSQQHQYDVLRSVGGSLIKWRNGWCHEQPDGSRVTIYGLNATAMFKLVEFGLIECIEDAQLEEGAWRFAVPEIAKTTPGARYTRVNQLIRKIA